MCFVDGSLEEWEHRIRLLHITSLSYSSHSYCLHHASLPNAIQYVKMNMENQSSCSVLWGFTGMACSSKAIWSP